jgi:hypothetical protein
MRPLDEWQGRTTLEGFTGRTPPEMTAAITSLDAYVRAFAEDAALGCHEPMSPAEREACARRRAQLHEASLRAQRAAARSRR